MSRNLSRREFFQRCSTELADTVLQKVDLKEIASNLKQSGKSASLLNAWNTVGVIAELPPGTQKSIDLLGENILLCSDYQGIWAFNSKKEKLGLRFERPNLIQLNQTMIWPKNRILSHITNEIVDLPAEESADSIEERRV